MAGSLNVQWIHGSADCAANADPPLQTHQFDENTFILRQNKCLNGEGPFLYLLLGESKALLFDSGARPRPPRTLPVRRTVKRIIDAWLARRGLISINLVVAHSHSHIDHLFGDRRFASALFAGMRGMGRLWQAAATINSVLAPDLLERAAEAGLRSLFVGFESLSPANLLEQRKFQNLRRDYAAAIRRLHGLGVMINGSFVFGMDGDDPSVFERTVEWAVAQGIETATFHILTPYPGTALYARLAAQQRITVHDWDLYDTRHVVFQPARMSPAELEEGYWRAYRDFYRWGSIARGAMAHDGPVAGLRHFAYAAGWKKFEPLWDLVIRAKQAGAMLPMLEAILSEFGRRPSTARADEKTDQKLTRVPIAVSQARS